MITYTEMVRLYHNSKKGVVLLFAIIFLSHILTALPLGMCGLGIVEMLLVFTGVSAACGVIMSHLWKGRYSSMKAWGLSYCVTFGLFVLLLNNYLLLSWIYTLKDKLFFYKYFFTIYGGEYGLGSFILFCFLLLQAVMAFVVSQYYVKSDAKSKSNKIYLSAVMVMFIIGFVFQPIGSHLFPDPYNIRYLPRLDSYITWQTNSSGLQVKVSKKKSFEDPCILNLHFTDKPVSIDIYSNRVIRIDPAVCDVISTGTYNISKTWNVGMKREIWNMIHFLNCEHFRFEYDDCYVAIKNPDVWILFDMPFPYEREDFLRRFYNRVLYP